MALAGFMLCSVEQEASSSFSLQDCISGHLFIVILLAHFFIQGVMLAPSCPGLGGNPRVILSWAAHWPIAAAFPLGFQFLLISLRKLFKRVPVSCASALPAVSGPSAEEALLFAVVQSTPSAVTSVSLYEQHFPLCKICSHPQKGSCDHGPVAWITPAITQGAHLCLQRLLLSCQLLYV